VSIAGGQHLRTHRAGRGALCHPRRIGASGRDRDRTSRVVEPLQLRARTPLQFGIRIRREDLLQLLPPCIAQQHHCRPRHALLHLRHVDVEEHAVSVERKAACPRAARDDQAARLRDLQLMGHPFGAVSHCGDDHPFHHADLLLARPVLRGRRGGAGIRVCARRWRRGRGRDGLRGRRCSGCERDDDENGSLHDCTWPISVAAWT
jgi:hypothetical protein